MSAGEVKLWSELRQWKQCYGVHVRKQAPIGKYIADFAIQRMRLIIEVDGHQHQEEEQKRRDQTRDEWFAGQGYKVLRFSTAELDEAFDGCVEEILREADLV